MALQRKIPYLVYFLFSVFNGSDTTFFFELSYEISFDYQADKAVDLGYHIQQNYDPYGQYLYEPLNFTSQKQHYSTEFTMTDPTDDNVACVFSCGGVDVPLTVTITNLTIKKSS